MSESIRTHSFRYGRCTVCGELNPQLENRRTVEDRLEHIDKNMDTVVRLLIFIAVLAVVLGACCVVSK